MAAPAPRARPSRMTSAQLIREIRRHQPAELTLRLGAGASKRSGVPLASEMIEEWRQQNQPPAGVPATLGQWLPGATPGAPPAQRFGEALRSLWDRFSR